MALEGRRGAAGAEWRWRGVVSAQTEVKMERCPSEAARPAPATPPEEQKPARFWPWKGEFWPWKGEKPTAP